MKPSMWIIAAATVAVGPLVAPPSRADDAGALWTKHCAACHGPDGKGDTKPGKALKVRDLTAAEVHAGFDRAKVHAVIEKGVTNPETGKPVMKGFGDKLSAAEVDSLADHVMGLGSAH